MSQLNESKARALIAYIASRSDIGKTKLMKLLYLMDFTMYERTKKLITNDDYKHWPYGPVPVTIWKKMTNGEFANLLNVEETPRGTGTYLKFTPMNPDVDTSVFSRQEKEVIDEILERYGDSYQDALVEMVHSELPYVITEDDEIIPPFLASYRSYNAKEKAILLKAVRGDEQLMKRVKASYTKSLPVFNRAVSDFRP